VEDALSALVPLLIDQESFVYLSALLVIRALAEHQPSVVFTALLQSFANTAAPERLVSVSYPILPQARRAMVGEALSLLLQKARALKDKRPAFYQQVLQLLPRLVPVCVKLARQRPSTEAARLVQERVNLSSMRIASMEQNSEEISANWLLEDADRIGKPSADLTLSNDRHAQSGTMVADLTPTARATGLAEQHLNAAAAEAADQILVRQSAVALLTEALITAQAAAYPYLDDALDIACGVLTMETGFTQSARAARR
jgi:L-amino acid N-acyltransferase YncA